MDKFIRKIQKLLHLRPRKIHLDYIAGILSIPLLITALILNIGNLKKSNTPGPTPTPQIIVVPQKSPPPLASPQVACVKSVGPIDITYPTENANSNTPCLYNVPNGNVEFNLRIQSTTSSDMRTITRNFIYKGANTPTATPAPTATSTPTPVASSSAH